MKMTVLMQYAHIPYPPYPFQIHLNFNFTRLLLPYYIRQPTRIKGKEEDLRGPTLTGKGDLLIGLPTKLTSTLCGPSIFGVYSMRKGPSGSGRVIRGLIVSRRPFGSITSHEMRPAPASMR